MLEGYAKVTNATTNLSNRYQLNVAAWPSDPAKAENFWPTPACRRVRGRLLRLRDQGVAEAIFGYLTTIGIKTNIEMAAAAIGT